VPLRAWLPVVGQLYPNIVLRDQSGPAVVISDFKGKLVLIELVGATSGVCRVFSVRNERGATRFRSIQPQPGLPSIERFTSGYAKLSLDHPEIVFVQLDRHENQYLLIGDRRFISSQTRANSRAPPRRPERHSPRHEQQ
jgi:hypothetical protein